MLKGVCRAFSSKRGFNINDIVEWWESKEVIALEDPKSSSARQLELVQKALQELCPHFTSWRLERSEDEKAKDLWVDKNVTATRINDAGELEEFGKQQTLRVRELSDGERSIIESLSVLKCTERLFSIF